MEAKSLGHQENETSHILREKYLQKTSDKGLFSKIDKAHLKLKKANHPVKTQAKAPRDASLKEMHRWQISAGKDASHYVSSGKCKPKP